MFCSDFLSVGKVKPTEQELCVRYYNKKSETPRIAHFMNPSALSNLHRRRSKPPLTKLFASMYILEDENEDLLEIERQIRRGTYKPPVEAGKNIGLPVNSSEVEMVLTLNSNENARVDRAERRKRREKSKIQIEQNENKNPDCECLPILMKPTYEIEKTTVHCGKKRKRSDDITEVNSPPKDPRVARPRLDPVRAESEPRVPNPVQGSTSWGLSSGTDGKYEEIVFEKILDFNKKESENDLEKNSNPNAVKLPVRIAQTEPGIAQAESVVAQTESGIAQAESGVAQTESGIAQAESGVAQTPDKEFDRRESSSTVIPVEIWPSNNDFQPFATELSTPPKISYESDSYLQVPKLFDDKIKDLNPKVPRKSSSRSRIDEFRELLSQTSPKIYEPTSLETGTSGQTVETTNDYTTDNTTPMINELESMRDSPDYEEIEIIDETNENSDREKNDREKNDREKIDKLDESRDSEEGEEVTLLETFDELEVENLKSPENPVDLRNNEDAKDDIEITEVRTKFLPGLPSQEDVRDPIVSSAEPIGESLTWKFPVVNDEHDLEPGSPGIPPVQNRDNDSFSETDYKDADGPGDSIQPDGSSQTIDPIQPDLVAKSEYSPASIQSSPSNSSHVESPTSQKSPESPSSSKSPDSPEPPEFEHEPTSFSEENNFETTQEKDPRSSPDCSKDSEKRSDDRSSDSFQCPKGGLFGQLMPIRTSPERTTVTSMSENIIPREEHEACSGLDESDPKPPSELGNVPPVPSDPRKKPRSDSPVLTKDNVHEKHFEENSPLVQKTLLETNQDSEAGPEKTQSEPGRISFSEFRSKSRPNSPVIRSESMDKTNDSEKNDEVKSSEKSSIISSILREGPSSAILPEDTEVSLPILEKRRPEPRRIPFYEFRKSRPNSPAPRKHIRRASVSSSSELEEHEDENEEEDLKEIIQRSSTRIKHAPAKKKIGPPVVKPFDPTENDKDSDSDDDLGPVASKS